MKKSLYIAMAMTSCLAWGQQTVDFEELTFPSSQNYWNGSDESGAFQSGAISFENFFNTEWSSWSGFSYSKETDAFTAGWLNQYSAYAPALFWNGSDETGGFSSQGQSFSINYNPDWGSWSGFAYSRSVDTETAGWGNQYSAFAGSGNNSSRTFVVNNGATNVVLTSPGIVHGIYVTNTTYAALSMRDGDMFAKQFGSIYGADGELDGTNGEDWFLLTITGLDASQNEVGTVEFYLADFRFPDDQDDYILDTWGFVDLSSLGEVAELTFSLSSSDVGAWGMNTPNYFALDDLAIEVAGETTLIDFEDLGFPTSGANDSEVYAVWYSHGAMVFEEMSTVHSIAVTNTTFAALSMRYGDAYTKQFGSIYGADGEEDGTNGEDWFKLTISGIDTEDNTTGTVEFYLADFRFEDDNEDYIVEAWQLIDLTSLGLVKRLEFQLESSDMGAWGMNTPNYFALDNVVYTVAEDASLVKVTKNALSVYPNPAREFFMVHGLDGTAKDVQLIALTGQVVKTFESLANGQKLDVSDVPAGMYFVQINGKSERLVIR